MSYNFKKMNGLGNDFIIFDAREFSVSLEERDYAILSNRDADYGCDQIIIMSSDESADAHMQIFNGDGSKSGACGNALRCVAFLLMQQFDSKHVTVRTEHGVMSCYRVSDSLIRASMGRPSFDWQSIPLSLRCDTLYIEPNFNYLDRILSLPSAATVNIGNPHCVFFLDDIDNFPLSTYGSLLEHNFLFPAGVNVSIVQSVSYDRLRLRVWERGAGLTLACGSAGCAAVIVGVLRGLCIRKTAVELPGGVLQIDWQVSDDRVWQMGEIEYEGEGFYESVASRL